MILTTKGILSPLIAEGRTGTIQDGAESVAYESRLRKARYDYGGKGIRGGIGKAYTAIRDWYDFKAADPNSFFMIAGDEMYDIFKAIRNGRNISTEHLKESADFMKRTLKDIDISAWRDAQMKVNAFKLQDGEVELTDAQLMSLYLTARQPEGKTHILNGGFKRAPITEATSNLDGKVMHKIKRQFEPVKPTEAELNMMINKLSAEQKRVAEAMSGFMSTTVAEWGNAVTLELYGYKKFTNPQYFPLFADKMYINQVIQPEVNFATLKNLGFTKSRKPNAGNPLVIGDIFTIFDRHISDMAAYSGYVLPLSDFNKIYNYVLEDGQTIKGLLDRQLGQKGTQYIRDFIISVNGDRVMTAPEDTPYDKLIRNYKAAAVGFNLSTAALQPLSYVRALSELDAKYLIKASAMKGNREEMLKYSGIAKIKSWGFSEIGIGKKFHQLYDDSETTVMQKIRDASMYLAGKADEVTWERLWNAVKLEILDTTDLVEGTEDFYQAVSERFDDVIGKTQVVHSIFDTPPIMRNHNTFYRMAFAFMSEPFKSVNNLRIDLQKFILSQSDAAKNKLARTALVTALNAAVAAALRSIISMLRDEEDEEYTKEDANAFLKFLKNFGDNMLGEAASFVPFADDLLDMINGYDPKRIDLAGINDLVKAIDRATNPNSTATTFAHVRDIAGGLG